MAEPRLPEKASVRRAFERAAGTYDAHSVLQREVGERLLAHLDPMRLTPARILDLGCGTGMSFEALSRRFPRAGLIGMDLAQAMLGRASARSPAWRRWLGARAPRLVCADAERLPFAAGSAGLVFSNLALQWCDPAAVFREVARVLGTGGVFLFSTFGPDTLKELRAAFSRVDSAEHVNTFVDMHDLGDLLVHSGLAEPVMEMEMITLEYASVDALLRDLRAIGARNSMPGRPRGMPGRRRWQAMVAEYERARRDGALPASYEVIYGHAWKPAPRAVPDGRHVIEFHGRSKS
ncbi:MAG TPA: malonyl-ACP O-methyltransferase BioC [Usitatibacter sp.]|nr:malonyl-ACP O-methyltransferase BioC [Usitatibacter sp.]